MNLLFLALVTGIIGWLGVSGAPIATDLTATAGVPTSSLPVAVLNNTSILAVATNGHIFQATQSNSGAWVVADISATNSVPLTNIPITVIRNGPWPQLQFVGSNSSNNDVFLSMFYVGQPIWTTNDMTVDTGVPQTALPMTTINEAEYALIDKSNNHIVTVSFNAQSSFFYVYDITVTADIPPTSVPISTLFGTYPNIQILSVDPAGSVMASYYNQPTPSGWAVYNLTQTNRVPKTKLQIAVMSPSQFFVVGANNSHVYNCLYGSGVWSVEDLTLRYNVPTTNLPLTILPNGVGVKFILVGTNGHMYYVYYDYNLTKYLVQDLNELYKFPLTNTAVSAWLTQRIYFVEQSTGHVWEGSLS